MPAILLVHWWKMAVLASLLPILAICDYSESHRKNFEDNKDQGMHLAVNKNAAADFR
jgi:hypothetical protein